MAVDWPLDVRGWQSLRIISKQTEASWFQKSCDRIWKRTGFCLESCRKQRSRPRNDLHCWHPLLTSEDTLGISSGVAVLEVGTIKADPAELTRAERTSVAAPGSSIWRTLRGFILWSHVR